MRSHPAVRIALLLVLMGIAVAASLSDGTARIWLSLSALGVIAILSRALPEQTRLPHPAVRGAMGVIGGVGIIASGFGVYLVFVLSGASIPVLVGVALLLSALAFFLTKR